MTRNTRQTIGSLLCAAQTGEDLPMTTPLEIGPEILSEVYAHARSGYPAEVVGFLLGPRDMSSVDEVHRCLNLQATEKAARIIEDRGAETAYEVDSKETLMLAKSERAARQVKVVYHSHPDGDAYFSDTDKRLALMEGEEPAYGWISYLVVSARGDGTCCAKLFRWEDRVREFLCIAEYS